MAVFADGIFSPRSFGFARMALHRIEAEVVPGNAGFERLLAKLGFHMEGVLRDYAFAQGEYQTLQMFSLLRRESDLA